MPTTIPRTPAIARRARRVLAFTTALAVAVALAGCGSGDDPVAASPDTNASDGLQIVATTSIIADIVETVGGPEVDLTTLVGPDQDPHTFEPTPSDSRAIAGADLVIENGLGLEEFLGDLIAAANEDVTRWNLSLEVPVLENEKSPAEDHSDEAGHEGEDGAEHEEEGQRDPHVWQSAENAQILLNSVESALSNADPGQADAYAARAAEYRAELTALDEEIRELVAEIPEEKRLLVTSHDTFGHFARDYDFEVVGVALPSTSAEAGGSSAGEIADLVGQIRAAGAPAIFGENIASNDLVGAIASEADVALGGDLYTDALGGEGSPGETYIGMLRHNATTIHAALTAP